METIEEIKEQVIQLENRVEHLEVTTEHLEATVKQVHKPKKAARVAIPVVCAPVAESLKCSVNRDVSTWLWLRERGWLVNGSLGKAGERCNEPNGR